MVLNARSHYDAIGAAETIHFTWKSGMGRRGLFQRSTKRFRFVATENGVVYDRLKHKGCYFNSSRNVIKMEFKFSETVRCSLLFLKHNMYLVGFGSGVGVRPSFEFGNLPITFNFTRVPGLSFCYPKKPSKFFVNGFTLEEAVRNIGEFDYQPGDGQDIGYIRAHLEFLMWFVSEAARFTRIYDKISCTFYNWMTSLTSQVLRDPEDLAATRSWKTLCEITVADDDTKLTGALKSAIGVESLTDVTRLVLDTLAYLGVSPPGWDM